MLPGRRRAPDPPKKTSRNLAQFGLLGMPEEDVDLDGDLEAELNALIHGPGKKKAQAGPKSAAPPPVNLDSMVADCMKDFDDDDDIVVDEEADGYLLQELDDLDEADSDGESDTYPASCVDLGLRSVIEERLSMYRQAESSAKTNGDVTKARRFGRALATLNDLHKKVLSGKAVNDQDIPPALASSTLRPPARPKPEPDSSGPEANAPAKSVAPAASSQDSPVTPMSPMQHVPAVEPFYSTSRITGGEGMQEKVVKALRERREEFKQIALSAKQSGDKARAMAGLQGVRRCDELMKSAAQGQAVGLQDVPAVKLEVAQVAPSEIPETKQPEPMKTSHTKPMKLARTFSRDDPIKIPDNPDDIPPADPSLYGAPRPPANIEEALLQRLAKYKDDEHRAKLENNSSRVRRLGRICKQYEDALRLHKAGKPFQADQLPDPPGFAPIPIAEEAPAAKDGGSRPVVLPQGQAQPTTDGASSSGQGEARRSLPTVNDKQLLLLQKRQQLFKEAALEAKRSGQLEQAKEYLRQSKGFDKLIDAVKSGLPVDLKTIPVPPQIVKDVNTGFVIVAKEDCEPIEIGSANEDAGQRHDMFAKLEKNLLDQIKMAESNCSHFRVTGDVASANKFQQLMENSKKDLDCLRFAFKRGEDVPKFYFEVRAFSRVVCNTDLTDNDLEMKLVQGVNYNASNPKDVHTYCKIEFPYPKDAPIKDRTALVRETNNPQYEHTFIVPLNRKDKACQRVFKRAAAKVEVWQKGGFLRSDVLIGTAQVKLQPLETTCVLHDFFALMDGRRPVGGQLEVRIRIRNPILTKQIEKVEEKWLVLQF